VQLWQYQVAVAAEIVLSVTVAAGTTACVEVVAASDDVAGRSHLACSEADCCILQYAMSAVDAGHLSAAQTKAASHSC
jgi:hypothetical protein